MKLEIYNYLPEATPHAKFQSFLVSSLRPKVAPLDARPRSIRHYVSLKVVPFRGLER